MWGVARRGDLLKQLQADSPPGRFLYSVCDVGSLDDVRVALHLMAAAGFVPDVAILNAGVNLFDLEPEFDFGKCEQTFRVNLFGTLVWVEHLLPRFQQRGHGHFVAISSVSAFLASSHGVAYGASKAALSMAFESLRRRYRRVPVRFTTVHLGPLDTAMWPGPKSRFLLSPGVAAERILAAVERQKDVYDYPALIVLVARVAGLIPTPLYLMIERVARAGIGAQRQEGP